MKRTFLLGGRVYWPCWSVNTQSIPSVTTTPGTPVPLQVTFPRIGLEGIWACKFKPRPINKKNCNKYIFIISWLVQTLFFDRFQIFIKACFKSVPIVVFLNVTKVEGKEAVTVIDTSINSIRYFCGLSSVSPSGTVTYIRSACKRYSELEFSPAGGAGFRQRHPA